MTAPGWLNDVVAAFGRQMGLKSFGLNDRDVAGVTFENGVSVRLEYAREALAVTALSPCGTDVPSIRRLLVAAHPAAHPDGTPVRAVRLARLGSAAFAVRIPERSVTVTEVERAFRVVWGEAVALGRRSQ